MNILVCGAAGFIGSALVQALVAQGHRVTGTIHTKNAPPIDGVAYTEADLTARGCWNTALACASQHGRLPIDIVYMCAGKTGGSGLDPMYFVTDNAVMALQMFRSCAEFGVRRIVAMSSTTGYSDTSMPMHEDDYFYGDVADCYFHPGHTRRFIERLGQMYAKQLEVIFVRCAGAYGPGDDFDPQTSHVIAATVRKVAERQNPITVWGTGENQRNGTYIDDLIDALVRCAHLRKSACGAYNIANEETISINAILGILLMSARHEPVILHDATKPAMLQARRLHTVKAREVLGWTPKIAMVDGLLKTLRWYEAR